jgi:bacterioferritin
MSGGGWSWPPANTRDASKSFLASGRETSPAPKLRATSGGTLAKRRNHMHKESVGMLNEALADELAAIHQYMYFHFHCDDQGYDPLAALFKNKAIEEMLHAERLAERILFLKGEVDMEPAAKVQKIQDVAEMLSVAKSMEEGAVKTYNRFGNECGAKGDNVSKALFEDLATDEERHYDNFETTEEYLKRFGEQFLALQTLDRIKQVTGERPGKE